jgi:hypothetical protein
MRMSHTSVSISSILRLYRNADLEMMETAFEKFISGPPGGLALPLTPTRLSDLAGGVYGMGASVASTGAMAKRPAIKAANSLAGGENYDDVLQYYQVSRTFLEGGLRRRLIDNDPSTVSFRSKPS